MTRESQTTMKDADTLVLVSRDWRDMVLDEVKVLREENVNLKSLDEYHNALFKQIENGCDGHCAIDECVCEKDQRLVDLREERDTLAAQNVAMLKWFKDIKMCEFFETDHGGVTTRSPEQSVQYCINIASKALALTSAEAVEKMRRKDEVMSNLLHAAEHLRASLHRGQTYNASADDAIEAARKEGVK